MRTEMLIVALVAVVLAVAPAAAADLTFEAVADSYVDPADPAATHGADADVRVGGDGAGNEGRTTYLRFNVTGTQGVASARVSMKCTNAGGGGSISVVKDNGWDEAAMNWNDRPAHESGVLSALGTVAAGQVYAWDVTAAIAGDGVYSFAIHSTDDDGSWWESRESAGMHPSLSIKTGGGGELPAIFGVHPQEPRHFAYDRKPFFFVGKTAFTLLARSDAEMQKFVDESAADGFSQFRVWMIWKIDPAWGGNVIPHDLNPFGGTLDNPDMNTLNTAQLDALERLLSMMEAKGIVAEVAGFNCPLDYTQGFTGQMAAYIDEIARRLDRHANAYFEVANEYTHGCYMSGGLSDQFVRDVAARFLQTAPDRLVTVSAGGDPVFAGEAWQGILNYHLPRVATWWLDPRDVFPPNQGWVKPQVSDEPTGSATQEEYDAYYKDYMGGLGRDTDGDHFRWAAYIATVLGGSFTFHSHKGITAATGPSPGKEFMKPLRRNFEGHVNHWLIAPDAALVKDCAGADCFSATAGDQRLLYVLNGAGKTVQFDLGPGDRRAVWLDPGTAAVVEERDSAGGVQPLTVPPGQDAFFVSSPKVSTPDGGVADSGGTGDGGIRDGGTQAGDGSAHLPDGSAGADASASADGSERSDVSAGADASGRSDASVSEDESSDAASGGAGGCSCATVWL